jgi:hypothetical protein
MLAQQYHDGTTERSLITDTVNPAQSTRTWKQSKRLNAAALITLRNFFEQQMGGLIPFYFYNPMDALPTAQVGSNYDPTGDSVQGRVCVFFRGSWTERVDIGRSTTGLELVEVSDGLLLPP